MLVSYGRQAKYHRAGNKVECRYCVHYGAAPPPKPAPDPAPVPYCKHRSWYVEPDGNCTHFERAVGTDDA